MKILETYRVSFSNQLESEDKIIDDKMQLPLLGKLFSGSSEKNISFYNLYMKMRRWRESNTYPYEYELPDSITFPPDFWKRVIQLYKETKYDAHERAISVFWADGDLILSSVVRGTTSSVTPKNKVSVKYGPSRHKNYLLKEVFVDDKLYSRKDVYEKRVPSQIEVKYLFNMHTHPPHTNQEGRVYYSFFSLQDLKSLLASGAVITGMIGDKLWLLIRTNLSPSALNNFEEYEINVDSLNNRLNIGVYCGEFNGKLRRLTSPK